MLQKNDDNEDVPRLFRVITEEEEASFLEDLMSGDPELVDDDSPWEKGFSENPADKRYGIRRYGIPERKRHDSNIVDRVPATYLRRIQMEMETGDYDARTVLSACQGLEHGSKEFAAKYFEARLAALQAGKARIGLPVAVGPVAPVSDASGVEISMPVEASEGANPFIVRYPSDLFSHFGIWITALVGLEIWNSWKLGAFLDQYLVGGIAFLTIAVFFGFFFLNSVLWFRFRNSLSSRFLLPGGILLVVLFILAAALHFYQVVDVSS